MGVGGVSYPISNEVMRARTRFPNVAARVPLPAGRRCGREIVRLLDNIHYDHIAQLLAFIDHAINRTEPIGHRVLVSQDPFQLNQALAELYLHSHLTDRNCGEVSATVGPANQRRPDIEMRWGEWMVLLEVYNPIGLIGFQTLLQYPTAILRYLDLPIGFEVEIELRSADRAYPYQIGSEANLKKWLREFASEAAIWLQAAKLSDNMAFPGLSDVWRLDISLTKIHHNPAMRSVRFGTSTFSTDDRLPFECGTEIDTARSRWGKKLRSKLSQRQCGDQKSDTLRLLIVNFSQAGTAWPDFICWPEIAKRMDATVRMLVDEIGGSLPYDVVIPARLGVECYFAPTIVLDGLLEADVGAFAGAAGLDRPFPPRKSQ